jgi:hypothetical protein
MGNNEEMIYREAVALSGDMKQIADNLQNDYEERKRQADAMNKDRLAGGQGPWMAMRSTDFSQINKDLCFISQRLLSLIEYIKNQMPSPSRPSGIRLAD